MNEDELKSINDLINKKDKINENEIKDDYMNKLNENTQEKTEIKEEKKIYKEKSKLEEENKLKQEKDDDMDKINEEKNELKQNDKCKENTDIDKLKEENKIYKEKYLYKLAEIENHRKRTEKELINTKNKAEIDFAKKLLFIIDNIDACIEKENDEKMVNFAKKIKQDFTKMGIKEMNVKINDDFDYNLCEALFKKKTQGFCENKIVEIFQKGYFYNDFVLRYAKVIISE